GAQPRALRQRGGGRTAREEGKEEADHIIGRSDLLTEEDRGRSADSFLTRLRIDDNSASSPKTRSPGPMGKGSSPVGWRADCSKRFPLPAAVYPSHRPYSASFALR